MPKRLIIALVVLLVLVLAGTAELLVLQSYYTELHDMCSHISTSLLNGYVDIEQYDSMVAYWHRVCSFSELCLPHTDIWEINARIYECRANIVAQEYTQAYANMAVLLELILYIPHNALPTVSHIL